MSKHSNCGCHTESTHTCHSKSDCGCHEEHNHSCHSECGCGCNSGAPKSAVNNQWASPASVKSTICDKYTGEKKEKTETNNQWT